MRQPVRQHPISRKAETFILYGEHDNLTSFETVSEFATQTNAKLSVMKGGEHSFHSDEQMDFLNNWILEIYNKKFG